MATRLTEEEKREIKRLRLDEDLGIDRIAIRMGRNGNTIRRALDELGIPRRSPGRRGSPTRSILPRRRHGMSSHPFYWEWSSMMKRCYDDRSGSFRNYGGRGIEVFGSWHDPRVYIEYVEVVLGSRPGPDHTINRIDNNGNYEPGNIEWAPKDKQSRNVNTKRNGTATSRYRWVNWDASYGKWRVSIRYNGRLYYPSPSSYEEEGEAGHAADKFAIEILGVDASPHLNFPDEMATRGA